VGKRLNAARATVTKAACLALGAYSLLEPAQTTRRGRSMEPDALVPAGSCRLGLVEGVEALRYRALGRKLGKW
jgi:hypothetical protein